MGWLNGPGAVSQKAHFIFDSTGRYLIGSDTDPNDDPPPPTSSVDPVSAIQNIAIQTSSVVPVSLSPAIQNIATPSSSAGPVSAIQNIIQQDNVSTTTNHSYIWIIGGVFIIGLIVLNSKK